MNKLHDAKWWKDIYKYIGKWAIKNEWNDMKVVGS